MSTTTLERLQADFEAAREDYNANILSKIDKLEPIRERYRLAANTLNVARKHGLNAAMLYKLSDGNVDPRKGGAA